LKSLTLFLLLSFSNLNAQNYVNKHELPPFGTPTTEIEWSANTTDALGAMITTGHTVVSAQEVAILTTKHSSQGNILWEKTWLAPSLDLSKNYGVAVGVDGFNNIYVVGASNTSTADNFDYAIVKYNSAGVEQWSVIHGGTANLADIPSSMAVDLSGNVFVTGASYGATSETDYMTLKLNGVNGNIEWNERYNHNNFHEGAIDISLDNNGNPVVTGASQSSLVDWDFATLKYNKTNGSTINENRLSSSSIGMEAPTAITKDTDDNFYITGQYLSSGNGQDVSTVKLDANFNEVWSVTYDGTGDDDDANSIKVDNNGNVFITGYSINKSGDKDLILLKYTSDGVFEWEQRRKPELKGLDVIGKRSVLSENGAIYIAGELTGADKGELVIIKYSSDGQKVWEQKHEVSNQGEKNKVSGISIFNDKILVFARKESVDGNKYYTLRLEEFERNNPVLFDNSNKPIYRQNELIVKFNRNEVIQSNINRLDIAFGSPEFWLTSNAITTLETRINLDRVNMVRIFRRLDTNINTSITRRGELIPVPDFWATFIMVFPENSNLGELSENLKSMFPLVEFSHPNYIATPLGTANDEYYAEDQASLHDAFPYDNANINVEPAWDYSSGKPNIKTGLLDTGTNFEHEDLTYDDGTGTQIPVMVDGWDFESNSSLFTMPENDIWADVGHGTGVAGVLGAVKNNDLGIAGIAGGYPDESDYPNIEERGTSIYSMRIFKNESIQNNPFIFSDLGYIADAIFISSIETSGSNFGYGLHIMNNSWVFNSESPQNVFTNDNILLVSQTVHYANRNEVVFVAGSGNEGGFDIAYPACYNDPWVINVGGTNSDGEYNIESSYGINLDLAAPAALVLMKTCSNQDNDDPYTSIGGTSFAAPHVSGVAALMLSYWNSPSDNLAPEDVEYIMQETAVHSDDEDYDEKIGHGRLNGGGSIEMIDLNNRFLYHFDSENNQVPSLESELIVSDFQIELAEPFFAFPFYNTNEVYPEGEYLVDIYEVTIVINHDPMISYPIIHSWERHSSSNLLGLADGSTSFFPYENVALIDVNSSSAELKGYIYHLKNIDTGQEVGWMPFNVNDIDSEAKFAYSVLARDVTNYVNVPIGNEVVLEVNPNPMINSGHLTVKVSNPTDVVIEIFDVKGIMLKKLFNGRIDEDLELIFELNNIPSGVYNVVAKSKEGQLKSTTFIKQ